MSDPTVSLNLATLGDITDELTRREIPFVLVCLIPDSRHSPRLKINMKSNMPVKSAKKLVSAALEHMEIETRRIEEGVYDQSVSDNPEDIRPS